MLHIGLLLTKNEGDILQEVLDANGRYFDKIYVLDGSNDESVDILRASEKSELCKVWRAAEIYPQGVNDHCREFLMNKAQEDYGQEWAPGTLWQDRIQWYCPGRIEGRQFKNRPDTFRSPERLRQRARERIASGHRQRTRYKKYLDLADQDFYMEKIKGMKVARKIKKIYKQKVD